MLDIWLIDATSYEKKINQDLVNIKTEYFKIKSFVRKQIIGEHILPTERTFSTGLLRIATILKRLGHSIAYYHLNDFLRDNIIENAADLPDIIAFSCVCPTVPVCDQLARMAKERKSGIIAAIGGAHINVALKKTMNKYSSFDRYAYGYDIDSVSRIINEKITMSIDNSSYVDYSILPYKLNEYDINIFSTLGCPFGCAYCQDGKMPYYENRLDGGINLIKDQIKRKKLIHFFDSTLGYSEKRLMEVCQALTSINHEYILSCDIRAEFINEKTVSAMEKAGFKEVRMGIETIDHEVLKRNNRCVPPETIMKKIDIIRKCSSIYLTLYSVSGLPGYTKETYTINNNMYKYLLESRRVDEIKNAQYVPYPRDDIDFAQRGVYIVDDNWENYDRQSYPVYYTDSLDREDIWYGYLETAKALNRAWLKGWGFNDVNDLGDIDIYPEYIVNSYLERKDNNEGN